MNPDLLVTVFVLVAITVPAAVGGVFVFRGTYYKSLPARIAQLEAENERHVAALHRQAEELSLWKSVATQTPEIKKLLEFYEKHDKRAEERFNSTDKQHAQILNHLLKIEAYLDERDRRERRPR